jgi:hypothetical protein
MRKLTQEYKDIANNFNKNLKERLKYNEPFEIELKFKCGRSGNSFLFFDAVVAHFTFLYCLKEKFFDLSADFDERLYIDIPIEKKYYSYENGYREYFYLCGGIFNIPQKVNYFVKRTDNPVINIIKENRVRTNAGTLKNYKMPILYDDKKTYRIKGIGDIEMLERILPENLNIGKKTVVGFGECKIKIKAINKLELFDNKTKTYIRPIPIEYLKQKHLPILNTIQSVFRPPYYGINAKYEECCI